MSTAMTGRDAGEGRGLPRRVALLGGLGALGGLTLGPLAHEAAASVPGDPSATPPASSNAWMRTVYDVIWREGLTPPNAARNYAFCAIAMYEAVASTSSALRSLSGQVSGLAGLPSTPRGRLDAPAVLTGAAATVTKVLFARASEASQNLLAGTYAEQVSARYSAGVPRGLTATSLEHGRRIGEVITRWISGDGYSGIIGRAYVPPVGPDKWQSTPPNFGTAIEPYWSEVRPMILREAAEVVPSDHIPFSDVAGSPFWEQADEVYQIGKALTDEQRGIARFWTDNPLLSGLPSGHWMLIVAQVAEQHRLGLERTVEAYAKLGVTLHDAFLNCWTWKYRINLLRPVTYVRSYIDPGWITFVNTPQFPEYTSGHSVASRAASTVLTDVLGELAFVDDSHADRGMPARRFASFTAAADEAAQSRLYGGIHFPMGVERGKAQGDEVGALVVARLRTRR